VPRRGDGAALVPVVGQILWPYSHAVQWCSGAWQKKMHEASGLRVQHYARAIPQFILTHGQQHVNRQMVQKSNACSALPSGLNTRLTTTMYDQMMVVQEIMGEGITMALL
jgi:hypothetical protein